MCTVDVSIAACFYYHIFIYLAFLRSIIVLQLPVINVTLSNVIWCGRKYYRKYNCVSICYQNRGYPKLCWTCKVENMLNLNTNLSKIKLVRSLRFFKIYILPISFSLTPLSPQGHCIWTGPMKPYTPLNIANIHNIDLIPATHSISSESC